MAKYQGRKAKRRTVPVWGWTVLAVVIILIVGGAIALASRSRAATTPPEISVAQAAQARDQGAFILDVRETSEWNQLHIPGATLIPLGQLRDRLNEVPKNQEVVVVCRSGNRSAQGRDVLKQAGYTNVTSMAGGVTQWQALGYPIATGE